MKLTKKIFLVLSASALMTSFAHADLFGGLSPDDQAKINRDQQVVPEPQDVDGSAWPRVVVYQRVNATPEQAAAVMFDFELQKVMFGPVYKDGKVSKPGITESTPVSKGAVTNINYTMVFPTVLGIGLPDEHYVVNDIMTPYNKDTKAMENADSYNLSWTFVSATSMKDTKGSVRFEPLPSGQTLIVYTNLISPPRPPLAKLIKKMFIQQVLDTVTALVNQISSERNHDTTKLNAQVDALRAALKK